MKGVFKMQKYLWYCPVCAKENKRESYHSDIFVPGMECGYNEEPEEGTKCNFCKENDIIKTAITFDEFQVLRYISNEPDFILLMNELKQSDPIEYQLKLSQFKANLAQQQGAKQNESNIPHCPHCNSTDISPIGTGERIGSIAMWGIFSKKINKSFKCNSCGGTF